MVTVKPCDPMMWRVMVKLGNWFWGSGTKGNWKNTVSQFGPPFCGPVWLMRNLILLVDRMQFPASNRRHLLGLSNCTGPLLCTVWLFRFVWGRLVVTVMVGGSLSGAATVPPVPRSPPLSGTGAGAASGPPPSPEPVGGLEMFCCRVWMSLEEREDEMRGN